MAALTAQIDVKELAARYAAGESMQALAAEHGAHRSTLYRWMLAGEGDEAYNNLVTHCLVQRIAEADEMIVDQTCDIARAREVARFARMDYERRRPSLYGQKQQMQVDHRLTVDDRLSASLDRLIGRVVEGQHSIVPEGEQDGTGVMSNDPSNQGVAPTQQIETLQALVDE